MCAGVRTNPGETLGCEEESGFEPVHHGRVAWEVRQRDDTLIFVVDRVSR